jgi:alanine racemase/UDP-N-acetylmuramoyl-tripeptide--D-alanyl-D-alanine ligase
VAIIEAAVSQKNEMDRLVELIKPTSSILTPIGKKHQLTLGDLPHIYDEILKLLKSPSLKNWCLIPQDKILESYLKDIKSPLYFWNQPHDTLPHAQQLIDNAQFFRPFQIQFPGEAPIKGNITGGFYYFIDLLNMAVKAAYLLGATSEDMLPVLENFTPEPVRTEIWKSPLGATFINATYSSDPQSIDQALKLLEPASENSRKVVIFGGFKKHWPLESSQYKRAASAFLRSQIDSVILYGDSSTLEEELRKISPVPSIQIASDFKNALETYQKEMKNEDMVLIKGSKKESFEVLTEQFNGSICTNQCIINLAAVKSNLDAIRSKLPTKTRLMVMLKALAYGTDDIRLARFLKSAGIDILGVSYVDEGVALRRAGIKDAIFVINAALYESSKIVEWGLEVGVSDLAFIEALECEALKKKKTLKLHLHVDTGMSRFGCRPEMVLPLAKRIKESPILKLEGIMTHFACSEDRDQDSFTLLQAQTLEKAIFALEAEGIQIPWRHAANSAAAIRFQFPSFNMVRIGLAAFGLYSSPTVQESLELKLAVSLISRIVGINNCKEGDTISYGRSYIVKKPEQKIAVLPIGYFDGLHRAYSGKGHVVIRGKKAPMVGKICMDFMMIDVSEIPEVMVGDPVLIFGEDDYGHYLAPEELAAQGGSIVYELITCLGPRIQRIFVYEEAKTVR